MFECGAHHHASRGDYLDIHITLDGENAKIGAIVLGPPLRKKDPVARCAEMLISNVPGRKFPGDKYLTEKEFLLAK
ncbi:hypothetical protein [Nannocystis pusilla]|uniref:hypothetical protein n=1 Tax=Nannocystis pusilla TaxID=889268 RepID=UPI003DA5B2DB